MGPLLEHRCGPAATVRILDCACGIGTQALGLATLGFRVTRSDLSTGAIERARAEALKRDLNLSLCVADILQLNTVPESGFDAMICLDNALPHLSSEEHLARAASEIRAKLRAGGTFLASIRDYDRLIVERPAIQGPAFYSDEGRRRIVFQLWDWIDERRYLFHPTSLARLRPAGRPTTAFPTTAPCCPMNSPRFSAAPAS